MAGLQNVPCRILDVSFEESLEIALLENIQREDLSPLEEAKGYFRLIEEFRYTQDMLAQKLGKSRPHIANTLRLLALPDEVKNYLERGELSAGHARALLNAEDPVALALYTKNKKLTVRQVEELARKGFKGLKSTKSIPPITTQPLEDEKRLSLQLEEMTGSNVHVSMKKTGGGIIRFQFKTLQEIDTFLSKLSRGYFYEKSPSGETFDS
jgi:ParB family chromosome partitioning protein